MKTNRTLKPWYRRGLRFTCSECGGCCTGAPGFVFVRKEDIARIAAHIGRSDEGLTSEHIRRVGSRYSLTEDPKNGDCCFLKRDGDRLTCEIYPVRPKQCRTWPFWNINLETAEAWKDVSDGCPGVNCGTLHTFEAIEISRKAKRVEDVPE